MKLVIEEGWCQYENKTTGILKFFYGIEALAKNANIDTIVFEKQFLNKIKNGFFKRLVYFIWLNTFFLFKLLRLNDDVAVLGVKYVIPFFKLPNVKYYPVVHDLITIKYADRIPKWAAEFHKIVIKNAITNGDKIITVSQTTKNEISDYFKYPKEKINVIYNTFSFDKKINLNENEVLNKYKIESNNYILAVASLSMHKNIDSLIEAHNELSKGCDIQLVIVGSGALLDELSKIANKRVIFTKEISDAELKILYKNAKIFTSPSLLEGFGIPIIDAQQFGIPVLCSNIPVFHEVAGCNSAIFVEPTPDMLAAELKRLINDSDLRKKLQQAGFDNIKRYGNKMRIEQLNEILKN